MYLLYLDESGDPNNVNENYFVLAGIAVFERQTHWISQQVDAIETSQLPRDITRPIEFHASSIISGQVKPWDKLKNPERVAILDSLAAVIVDSHESSALFGVAIHRPSFPYIDPIGRAFENITSRFDLFLRRENDRLSSNGKDEQHRGLIIMDKSRHEQRLQTLLHTYRKEGGPFGRLVNFSDVPLFTDSASSRLVQLADLVAWAIFRRYERKDARLFDRLVGRFDSDQGKIHGLSHQISDRQSCYCPSCLTRRSS